ncbi:MarR family transcriptional regulator [Indiicoccus explosivorum]|uniref:MarR family transcriptional regulator n=1 Tax=Indiicoccus explosivorum TaxID=1917864 RepID=UPI000B44E4B1|nr:MarR family transcriptional regulator [Indiicoccus explosivorum]
MSSSINYRNTEKVHYPQQRSIQECQNSLRSASPALAEKGDRFLEYFQYHATEEGVLFRTIQELTRELDMPHQTLTKILKILESNELIYRRNGIIGLWKK